MAEGTAGPNDPSVPFQQAIDYLRQKTDVPTRTWRDINGQAHDRAFVVAGAMKEELLADLRAAIDDGLARGHTLQMFRDRFDEIVGKRGWTGWTGEGTETGRAWRTRIIYETNMTTAYAAGRYKQMRDPDVMKIRPYWEYVHGYSGPVAHPRPEHVSWHGTILLCDDPWWQTHYGPNGWGCHCGVRNLTRRELERRGRSGPDQAPAIDYRDVRDPATGELVKVPKGIDLGWDHAPGAKWEQGLVPPQYPARLGPSSALPAGVRSTPRPADLPALGPGRPSTAKQLPAGLKDEEYVDAFLAEFGASRDRAVAWRDPAGHVVTISDQLFQDRAGVYKLGKRGRAEGILHVAEAIKDPDEIWLDWELMASGPQAGTHVLRRRYVRVAPESIAVFEWGRAGWDGRTGYPTDQPTEADRRAYLDGLRHGALLWRRSEK